MKWNFSVHQAPIEMQNIAKWYWFHFPAIKRQRPGSLSASQAARSSITTFLGPRCAARKWRKPECFSCTSVPRYCTAVPESCLCRDNLCTQCVGMLPSTGRCIAIAELSVCSYVYVCVWVKSCVPARHRKKKLATVRVSWTNMTPNCCDAMGCFIAA